MSIEQELKQFTGTSAYYPVGPITPNAVMSDGTKFLIERADCHWLISDIAVHMKVTKKLLHHQFVIWILRVNEANKATLTAYWDYDSELSLEENNLEYRIVEQHIPYTDFKEQTGMNHIRLYAQRSEYTVIFLPSEY